MKGVAHFKGQAIRVVYACEGGMLNVFTNRDQAMLQAMYTPEECPKRLKEAKEAVAKLAKDKIDTLTKCKQAAAGKAAPAAKQAGPSKSAAKTKAKVGTARTHAVARAALRAADRFTCTACAGQIPCQAGPYRR